MKARWASIDLDTKPCSSTHLSPKIKTALLLGACHRKGDSLPVLFGIVFFSDSDVSLEIGAENRVVESRSVEGNSRLMPKTFVLHSCHRAAVEY